MLSPRAFYPPPYNHLLGQYNAPNKRANVRKCIARTRVIRYTTLHGVCPMPIYVHRIADKIIDKDASPAPSIHRRRDDQKNPKTTFNTQQQSHSMSIHLLSHLSLYPFLCTACNNIIITITECVVVSKKKYPANYSVEWHVDGVE